MFYENQPAIQLILGSPRLIPLPCLIPHSSPPAAAAAPGALLAAPSAPSALAQRRLDVGPRRALGTGTAHRHSSSSPAGRRCRWRPSSRRPGRWWPGPRTARCTAPRCASGMPPCCSGSCAPGAPSGPTRHTPSRRRSASATRTSCRSAWSTSGPGARSCSCTPSTLPSRSIASCKLVESGITDEERKAAVNSVNRKYILRNYLCQSAIDAAEQGDYEEVHRLLKVMQHPYDEQPGMDKYARLPPAWA